ARAVLAGHEAEVGFELMRVVEAPDVVDRGEEGGGGDGADAGDGAQPGHARILDGEMLDRGVGIQELLVEGAHEGEQRRHHRAQAARQGQALHPVDKVLRTAGRDAKAVLAEQGPDERDIARARPDHGVPDQQPAAHVALGIGEPMRGTVRAEPACFCQGPGITPVGLHLASPRRVHRREVRVRDNHLVAKRLETAGHPFAIGRGLDQDPSAGPGPEHGGEALGLGADALFENRAPFPEDANRAFPLVHVDANMVHGWPLPFAALTAGCSCGAMYATTSSERPAASSHLPSWLLRGLDDRPAAVWHSLDSRSQWPTEPRAGQNMAITRAVCLIPAAVLCLLVTDTGAQTAAKPSVPAPAAKAEPLRQLHLTSEPWTGDFDKMLERRLIRIHVPYSRSLYFVDRGRERGIAAEVIRDFERHLNARYARELAKRPLTVYI